MSLKRAAGYVRVSTEEQSEGWSLDGQEQQVREYAARSGYEIVSLYRDELSGTKAQRPGFDKMLEDAERGHFEAIIVIHTSRLFRNVALARRYKDELRNKLGVDVLFVNQPIMDPSDPSMFMMEAMNELFDEYYIHQLRFWTKLGKKTRARSGLWNGTLPFGYISNADGDPIPHPINAAGVRLAFEAYATGKYSDKKVAELLNRQGYRTTGNWGARKFTKDTVNPLLKNQFYLGFTKYKDELMPGRHEPLIDQALFDQCEAVRARRRRRGRASGPTRRVYLFSGLARCSECGLTLRCQSTRSKGKFRYYRHTAAVRGYDCSVPGTMIRADNLERQWLEIISRIVLPADWRVRIEALAGNADERQDIQKEREETESRLRRLSHLYRDLLIDEREYRDTRDRLQRRLSALVLPGDPRVIDAGIYLENLTALWAAATLKEKQEITRVMAASITVDVIGERILAIEPVSAFRLILEGICQNLGVAIT